jgi:hypothetical protein
MSKRAHASSNTPPHERVALEVVTHKGATSTKVRNPYAIERPRFGDEEKLKA